MQRAAPPPGTGSRGGSPAAQAKLKAIKKAAASKAYGRPKDESREIWIEAFKQINEIVRDNATSEPLRLAMRARLGMDPDAVLIGCFGRIRAQKGVDLLVQAGLELLPSRPRVQIIFTGRITPDNRAFADDLQARIKAFHEKERAANTELQTGQQRLQSTQANVLRQSNERLNPIINQAMTARGANLAVDTEATLARANGIDITADVLTALNAQVPSVSVTPLPQAAQPAQQRPTGR